MKRNDFACSIGKPETFGQKLKDCRKRLSLSQAQLASLLDVSPRAVWQWEHGDAPSSLTQEAAFSRIENASLQTAYSAPAEMHVGMIRRAITAQLCRDGTWQARVLSLAEDFETGTTRDEAIAKAIQAVSIVKIAGMLVH